MEEIGKILPKVLRPQFSRLEPPVVEVLCPLWSRVAGKLLAKKCRPEAFNTGILTLSTTDPDWAEPLKQMREEIRAHVNDFLGGPVVRHLRIISIHKFAPGDRSPSLPESFSVATSEGRDWPRQSPPVTPGIPQSIGRSQVKFVSRKHRKVL